MSTVDETAFVDSDNEIKLILIDPTDLSEPETYPRGKPYDFLDKGVNLMELFVNGLKFSSSDGIITYGNGGVIIIKLGDNKTITRDVKFSSSIKVYDDGHPKGQFIVNYTLENSSLSLMITDPSTC